MNSSTTSTTKMISPVMATPEQPNKAKVVSSTFCDDFISDHLTEGEDKISSVQKYNMTANMSSQKKFSGIYSHHTVHYQLAFPCLRPHMISYYKTGERKKKEAQEAANKEKYLALARSALTMVNNDIPNVLSDSGCSSSNAIMGTDDEESTVNQRDVLPANCQHFLTSLGIYTASYFLTGDTGDLSQKYKSWKKRGSYASAHSNINACRKLIRESLAVVGRH
jgi:hypothetical protein